MIVQTQTGGTQFLGQQVVLLDRQAQIVSNLDQFQAVIDSLSIALEQPADHLRLAIRPHAVLLGVDLVLLDLKQGHVVFSPGLGLYLRGRGLTDHNDLPALDRGISALS